MVWLNRKDSDVESGFELWRGGTALASRSLSVNLSVGSQSLDRSERRAREETERDTPAGGLVGCQLLCGRHRSGLLRKKLEQARVGTIAVK